MPPSVPGLPEAFAYCRRVTHAHYENFPVGSHLAPRALRPYIHAIYAFARAADDFADEAEHEGKRLHELDAWEERLERCLSGRAEHPVFVALAETIRRFELADRELRDLLDAFRQDCRVKRYATWDELLDYARRSANPIGRLVLRVFGHRDPELDRCSDAICTALQLTNFWQDVVIDLAKDRIYLPAQDRERHGVREADLSAREAHAGVRSLLLELTARTQRLFEEGEPLLAAVRYRLRVELRCVWLGGKRILAKIEQARGDVLAHRPVLTRFDRLSLVTRSFVGGLP